MGLGADSSQRVARLKRSILAIWGSRAEVWAARTPVINRWFSPAARAMLRELRLERRDTVLEIAAGTGAFTSYLGRAVGPEGHVVTTDSGRSMVRLGRRNSREHAEENVAWRVLYGERIPEAVGPGPFSLGRPN